MRNNKLEAAEGLPGPNGVPGAMGAMGASGALDGIVVLDLSGGGGNYCSKLFADLGADVILIEPPGGLAARDDLPETASKPKNDGLRFEYENANKRSIVLDLATGEGQDTLRRLAANAHVLIETAAPGNMTALGLGYEALRDVAPQLVMTSITPFGQTGPYAQWQAHDITLLAMGGMLYLGGYPDTAPMAVFGGQAWIAANLFAAVATMAAVYEAETSGQGQHIDVSAQECVVMGMENAIQFFDLEGVIRKRNAGQQRQAGTGVFACRDGYIYLMAGGIAANRFWLTTTQWLIDEGVQGAEIFRDSRWLDADYLQTAEAKQIFADIFCGFARQHDKRDLYARAQARRIPIAPVSDSADIVADPQLQARGFFVEVQIAGQRALMPGAPYRLSATPWRLRRRAPLAGEHSAEILSGLPRRGTESVAP